MPFKLQCLKCLCTVLSLSKNQLWFPALQLSDEQPKSVMRLHSQQYAPYVLKHICFQHPGLDRTLNQNLFLYTKVSYATKCNIPTTL